MNHHWKTIHFICAFSLMLAFHGASHAGRYSNLDSHSLINNDRGADALPVGRWGGEHISLEITAQGARIESDCAHGIIEQRIILNRRGRFDVPGAYVEEHGGPIRADEPLNGYPVRFIGRIRGNRMTLTVIRSDTRKVIETFTLVRDQEPSLVKCK